MTTVPIWSHEANAYVEAQVPEAEKDDLRLQAVVQKNYVSGSDRTYFFEHAGKNWMSRSEDGESIAEKREKLRRVITIDDVSPGRREEVEQDLAAAAGDHLIVDGRHFVRTLGPALVLTRVKGVSRANLVMPDVSASYGHWFRDGRLALSAYDLAAAQEDMRRLRSAKRQPDAFEVILIDQDAVHDHVAAIGARMALLYFVATSTEVQLKHWSDVEPLLMAREYANGILGRNGIRHFAFDDKAGGIYQDMMHDDAGLLDIMNTVVDGMHGEWTSVFPAGPIALRVARDRFANHIERTSRLSMDDLVGIRI